MPLLKYPATTTPYKGMVLINPGGPGESGVAVVYRAGETLSTVVGSNYDVVGFDPRGVGYSTPSGICVGSGASPLKRRSIIPGVDFAEDSHGPELPSYFFRQPMRMQPRMERCAKWKLEVPMMPVRI